ncbi:MAG: MoxR family ATPase [Treponema sp.]|jgi:MoxR-like ATPase|nr:MoxR family ATPase [Treponema sp.]
MNNSQAGQCQKIAEFAQRIRKNIEKVFLGKTSVVDMIITAFLARGHVLLEDVPGTGKTILARAFAASLDLSFARIQCTPDLLPADILGISVWRQAEEFDDKKGRFIYNPGPIVNQFILVDEINRATPRTQSALLEAMAESQITVDGSRIALPEPFFVMATENPVEFEGTFPLPEAQKDRFLISLGIGYPDAESESRMLENQRRITHPVTDIKSAASTEEIAPLQEAVSRIHVEETVKDYLLALVDGTRHHPQLRAGISPRGSLALYRSAQALAGIRNRDFVTPEDVKEMAKSVFRQRLLLASEAIVRGITADRIIQSILDSTPIPEYRTA